MEKTPPTIQRRIRVVIATLGLHDYEFADRAGITNVHLSNILKGKVGIGKHARRGIIAASEGRLTEADFPSREATIE